MLGYEVRVENGYEFSLSGVEAVFEGASFVAFAIRAVDVRDRQALSGMACNASTGYLAGFVGGIVEDLNVEEFTRVVKARDGFHEALDDVPFVEDGQLDSDARPYFDFGRSSRDIFRIEVIIVDEPVAMKTIGRENKEDQEVGYGHGQIKGIGMVDAREGAVGELMPVMAERALREKNRRYEQPSGHEVVS